MLNPTMLGVFVRFPGFSYDVSCSAAFVTWNAERLTEIFAFSADRVETFRSKRTNFYFFFPTSWNHVLVAVPLSTKFNPIFSLSFAVILRFFNLPRDFMFSAENEVLRPRRKSKISNQMFWLLVTNYKIYVGEGWYIWPALALQYLTTQYCLYSHSEW